MSNQLIGRNEELKKMNQFLKDERYVFICGMPGIGKTALMKKKYMEELKNGSVCVHIDYDNTEKYGDIDQLFKKLDNLATLCANRGLKTFIFFDEVGGPLSKKEIDRFYTLSFPARVIVATSCVLDHTWDIPQVHLESLNKEEAIRMFYSNYHKDLFHRHKETVDRIVSVAHQNTLLIEMLALIANKRNESLESFCERIEHGGLFKLEEEVKTAHNDSPLTIKEAIIDLYDMSKLNDEQRRIMERFIDYPSDQIVRPELIEDGASLGEIVNLVKMGWIDDRDHFKGFRVNWLEWEAIKRQASTDIIVQRKYFR